MAGSETTASFAIGFDGSKVVEGAGEAADSLQALRDSVVKSQDSMKSYGSMLRNLKGKSDEVAAAKDILRAKMAAEQASVTKATLAMLKQGTSLEKLAAQERKLTEEKKKQEEAQKKTSATVSSLLGPLGSLRDKLGDVRDMFSGGNAASALFKVGLAGIAAAAAAVTVAVAATVVGLAAFILKGADAARSAGLLRQAAMGGNAQWGKNFGEQVDALARKIPMAKEQIDALGADLAKSRIGGQVWVDTLNAVGQASSALGDDAGNKLKEFITRGRQMGRMQINPQEMIGTGVDFSDLANALGSSMKGGVAAAKQALVEGTVDLGTGAAAMRKAVESKFGQINADKMLSLDNLTKKLGESFDRLTRGIDLEPVLKAFKELADMFDTNTETGMALKQVFEVLGADMGKAAQGATPIVKKFIYGAIAGVQELVIGYLRLRNGLRSVIDSKALAGFDVLGKAMQFGKGAAIAIAAAVAALGVAVGVALAPFIYGANLVANFFSQTSELVTKAMAYDWAGLGSSIVDGLIGGLRAGADRLGQTVTTLADTVKTGFKDALGIHSPSKVFAEYGRNTTAGFEEGIDDGAPGANASVAGMVSVPSAGGRGGAAAAPVINLTINVEGSSGEKIAAELKSSGVIDQIFDAITDALRTSGTGTPSFG